MVPVYVFWFCVFFHMSVMLLWAMDVNGHHDDCPDSFHCGSLGKIHFPFTTADRQGCGALAIQGCDDKYVSVNIRGKKFLVTKIHQRHHFTVNVIDEDLSKLLENGSCKAFDHIITLPPPSPLGSFSVKSNITIFNCNRKLNVSTPENFLKNTSCGYDIFFGPPDTDDVPHSSLAACSTVQLPTIIDGFPNSANPSAFLTAEIPIQFNPSFDCARCLTHDYDDDRPGGRCCLDKGKIYCARRYAFSQ